MDMLVESTAAETETNPALRLQPTTKRTNSKPLSPLVVEGLYKRWRKPLIQWICKKNVPRHLADDLSQEVFCKILKYVVDFDEVANIQAYIFRIATNVVAEWAERCANRAVCIEVDSPDIHTFHQMIDDETSEVKLGNEQVSLYWEELISRLPSRKQSVLRLHIYEGLTYNQIMRRKNLTYRTVLRDMVFAYSKLREWTDRNAL